VLLKRERPSIAMRRELPVYLTAEVLLGPGIFAKGD
jgi:hypothetical protein